MKILQESSLSIIDECTYLPEKKQQLKYFCAHELSEEELNKYLTRGWRKFGICYFRPRCPDCQKCIPIRIPAANFKPSKSQRRIFRKASDVIVNFGPLEFRNEIYEMYKNHSEERFQRTTHINDFFESFYMQSCPVIQSEYYYNNKLIGIGFLDKSNEALSSVYFIFDTEYSEFSLGTYSVLKEIEYTASIGFKYYYLGYYIKENRSMAYKGRFSPQEIFDWDTGVWK